MDRNSLSGGTEYDKAKSLSARRAWIEIKKKGRARRPGQVALRKESVDRNDIRNPATTLPSVALRKESVDRNNVSAYYHIRVRKVALRKESVDRNALLLGTVITYNVALRKESVDRNFRGTNTIFYTTVALRKESVDRNLWKGRPPPGS